MTRNALGRTALCAAMAFAVSTGIGRFAFTPILPLLEGQLGLPHQGAALISSANNLGYLVGGVTSAVLLRGPHRSSGLRTAYFGLVVSFLAPAVVYSTELLVVARLLAGFCSALVFVVAATVVGEQLRDKKASFSGLAYGGVGAGIVAAGLVVPAANALGGWRWAWLVSAGLIAILGGLSWNLGTAPQKPAVHSQPSGAANPRRSVISALLASYFLEGLGYIVAATFLVSALRGSGPAWAGSVTWIGLGVAAVPSTVLWTRLGERVGKANALALALLAQAVSVFILATGPAFVLALVAALMFGSTFMGVTAVMFAIGADVDLGRSGSWLTVVYGVGQILGPMLVGVVSTQSYHLAFAVSGAALLVGAGLATVLRRAGSPQRLGELVG